MYATLEDRTHGKKRPCARHPEADCCTCGGIYIAMHSLREVRMKREMLAKGATALLVVLLALNLLSTFVTRAGGKPDTDARIH
jgi:hypothetical protein